MIRRASASLSIAAVSPRTDCLGIEGRPWRAIGDVLEAASVGPQCFPAFRLRPDQKKHQFCSPAVAVVRATTGSIRRPKGVGAPAGGG